MKVGVTLNKRLLVSMIIIAILLIYVCYSNISYVTGKPPKMKIFVGDQMYNTKLGTYCWKGLMSHKCVDNAGAIELLKGEEPIVVQPNEKIEIRVKSNLKPDEYNLTVLNEEAEKSVKIKKYIFSAPKEKGIYYYAFSAWWMDENRQNISNGDAYYAFVLKVE